MAEKVLQETRKVRPPFLARHSPSATAVGDAIRDYRRLRRGTILRYVREDSARTSYQTFCRRLHDLWDSDEGMGIRQARWYRIASQQIDINKEPVNFIDVMLGFLWMSESDLGFDPTIQQTDGERFIEIERNGRP
ncbi:hypothetical protein E4U38_001228 [Claviceps purpurea]|nr:hypothetical protein E4U38_001228 [Claviceps purpurea]